MSKEIEIPLQVGRTGRYENVLVADILICLLDYLGLKPYLGVREETDGYFGQSLIVKFRKIIKGRRQK